MKKVRIIAAGLVVFLLTGFLFYTYIQPQLNKKTANEQLIDITRGKQSTPENITQPSSTTNAAASLTVQESAPAPVPSPQVVRAGQFRGAEGEKVSGGTSLVVFEGKNYLRLEGDFQQISTPRTIPKYTYTAKSITIFMA